MAILNESGVIFDEASHTYYLDGVELHGITKYIGAYISPNKYDKIPEHILKKAAERGSEIHRGIEAINLGFPNFDNRPEYTNYRHIIDTWNLHPIANEYTVTDREFFATNIDCVYKRGDEIILADYKTTAKIDHEYLRWQLSVCAYLFEMQNPHLSVSKIAGIWLKEEKFDYFVLDRVSDEEIKEFLSCAKQNEVFVPNKDALAVLYDVEQEIINIEEELKRVEERKKQLQEVLRIAMERSGTLSLKSDRLSITYKKPSTSTRFDSKRFKEENQELYNQYLTTTEVKATVLIRTKNG